jgi:ATP-dependent Clp protease ATP-binding subunit ClpA
MFDRFTDHARKVMGHARQEAQRTHHDYICTEHMLVGLVRVIDCTAAEVLRSEDVDLARARAMVDELVPHGVTLVTMGQIPFTASAKRVLELALEASAYRRDTSIGTAYLLLGLIREDGTATRVLEALGVNLARVAEALGDSRPAPSEPLPSLVPSLERTSEIAQLKAEIEELRRRNDALEKRIDRLESGS